MYEDRKTYAPLSIYEHGDEPGVYTLLFSDDHMVDVADVFEEVGRTGGGYSWADVAIVLMQTRAPEIEDMIEMDPEAGTFTATGEDLECLQQLAVLMVEAFRSRKKLARLAEEAPWEWE